MQNNDSNIINIYCRLENTPESTQRLLIPGLNLFAERGMRSANRSSPTPVRDHVVDVSPGCAKNVY